jgi:hypothetical protein
MSVAATAAPTTAKTDREAVSHQFVEYMKTRTATTRKALVADIVELGTRRGEHQTDASDASVPLAAVASALTPGVVITRITR